MAYRAKTLRRMSPTARKLARLAGEIDSAVTRLKNLIPEIQQLELDSEALKVAKQIPGPKIQPVIKDDPTKSTEQLFEEI